MVKKLAILMILLVEIVMMGYLVQEQARHYYAKRWVQDDAYISFRFAKNLIKGDGLVYNPGQYVEGYTNFLWTVISAIPQQLGREDPLEWMHQFSLVLWIASYLLLMTVGIMLFKEGIWIAPLAPLPLLYHHSYNAWYFSGMETPLVSFFTILAIFFFTIDNDRYSFALFGVSLAGVGLIMTRPDGVFFLAALALATLICYRGKIFKRQNFKKFVLLPALPILLVYLPYTAWRIFYYGSFYPNTYYAKVAYLTFYSRGWSYLKTFFVAYPIAPFLTLLILGLLMAGSSARRFLTGVSLSAIFVFFYIVRLGGDFMEWRFVTPVTGIIYPGIIIGVQIAANSMLAFFRKKLFKTQDSTRIGGMHYQNNSAWICAAGLLLGIIALYSLQMMTEKASASTRGIVSDGQETIELLSRYCDPMQPYNWPLVGRAFDKVLPENAMIATTSAGAIPFFCMRPCVDLHGLTDPDIARVPVTNSTRGRVGHEHWLQDYEKMRQKGVNVYLYWADPKTYAVSRATPPQPNFEVVSVLLPNKKYVEIAIINPETVDLQNMKSNPDLIFFDPDKYSDKSNFYKYKSQFQDYAIIQKIDIGNVGSENSSKMSLVFTKSLAQRDFHVKSQSYVTPFENIILEDEGVRVQDALSWTLLNVRPDRDLYLVLRYDTSRGKYDLKVNESLIENPTDFLPNQDYWDECLMTIPSNYLQDNVNSFEMIRKEDAPGNTEFYFLWALQSTDSAMDGQSIATAEN